MIRLPWLTNELFFPPVELALTDPNGLLAAGGDLSAERLLFAYQQGIFPWYSRGEPILWWSPDPRSVIYPHQAHISKSLLKLLRKNHFRITFDHAFADVMHACAAPREYSAETWINKDVIAGYTSLHKQGSAHSIEVWLENRLVGGLYGVALGQVFYGESMFSRVDNASKVAFAFLIRELLAWNFQLIDCQVGNTHTESLGAVTIPRKTFQEFLIKLNGKASNAPQNWAQHVVTPWARTVSENTCS